MRLFSVFLGGTLLGGSFSLLFPNFTYEQLLGGTMAYIGLIILIVMLKVK